MVLEPGVVGGIEHAGPRGARGAGGGIAIVGRRGEMGQFGGARGKAERGEQVLAEPAGLVGAGDEGVEVERGDGCAHGQGGGGAGALAVTGAHRFPSRPVLPHFVLRLRA
jgi:hypothetical protein